MPRKLIIFVGEANILFGEVCFMFSVKPFLVHFNFFLTKVAEQK